MPQSILVADNDLAVRHMLRRILETDGYVVHQAPNGPAVLAVFQTHRPDIVLLAFTLTPLSHRQVVAQLRALPDGAQVPVVVLGGRTDLPASTDDGGPPRTYLLTTAFTLVSLRAVLHRATHGG
jgi:CheY-like chemotaxis protein